VSGHGLLLPFDTDDKQFARGFECGHVWTKLQETDVREFTVHWANAEMMIRVGEALGLEVAAEPLDGAEGTWCALTFSGEISAPDG
jgi:hypothetical protein